MNRGRLQPLVWPSATLIASGLTALVAEAAAQSVETITLYGLLRMTSDLVFLTGLVWLIVGVWQVSRRRKH